MSLFSNKIKKKLAISSSKNATYYKRENLIANVDDLKKTLNPLPELSAKQSNTGITFNTFPLTEITFSMVKKEAGNPVFVVNNSEFIDGHEVVFYKDGVDFYKFLIQYHFIKDRFFFASNKISSMGILSDEDKLRIVEQINSKYLGITPFDSPKELVVKVSDKNDSLITTVDDVYFHVNYLAGNDATRQLIQKYAGHIIDKSQPSGFKETLDKYI